MDDNQIDRLRDTLKNLIEIRSNMEQILKDLSATHNEMQEKVIRVKRSDVDSAQQKLLNILKQQTSRMSQSLDQMEEDNQQLAGVVQLELGSLLVDSSKHMDHVNHVQNDLSAGTSAPDQRLVVSLQQNSCDMGSVPPAADASVTDNNISDANDETGCGTRQSSFSID